MVRGIKSGANIQIKYEIATNKAIFFYYTFTLDIPTPKDERRLSER